MRFHSKRRNVFIDYEWQKSLLRNLWIKNATRNGEIAIELRMHQEMEKQQSSLEKNEK